MLRAPDPAPTDQAAAHPEAVAATGEALRKALRDVASPVVVVTTEAPDGPRGATIGSFTSVSLDPPLVSFSVTHGTQMHDALAATDVFAVHLLEAGQADLAAHFAIPDLGSDAQLAPFSHTRAPGVPPLLDGALGVLLCHTTARVEAGDHTLYLGEVTELIPGRPGQPLLYYRQSYRGVGEEVA